jgi:hypothetical protein
MEWKSPYIVYRINAEKCLEEVFWTEDIKKAKYWLTYIAQPGDVLCKTPAHPKHSHSAPTPEYWSHKQASGQACTDESAWRKFAETRLGQISFPAEQIELPQD